MLRENVEDGYEEFYSGMPSDLALIFQLCKVKLEIAHYFFT